MAAPSSATTPRSPLREIVQPFVDVWRAPRALWGVNFAYFLEGFVYFGILNYLALYFSDFVFRGVPNPNEVAHHNVMILTAGITLSMLFFGFVPDRKGIRVALIGSFVLMVVGRVVLASGPTLLGLEPRGLWSALHLTSLAGILFVVLGYGLYMPAAYAAVRKFTTPKTAGMAFAMLYALMNLGGWFNSGNFVIRADRFGGLGIPGMFWVYAGLTVVSLATTALLLTPRTVEEAIRSAREETERLKTEEAAKRQAEGKPGPAAPPAERTWPPLHLWVLGVALLVAIYTGLSEPWSFLAAGAGALAWVVAVSVPISRRRLAIHPLADGKFFFFIFALIPVQTLFTYNWFVLPAYVQRAFAGWIGESFEVASNLNSLLIFILCPIIAALTQKRKVYNMMVVGTFVMAAPAFLPALGANPWTLFGYIVLMTVGEAMWQPRFLQYAAEIAPEGRTGEYMGVAQLPWFLTKVLVPWLYSGWMMDRYCPADGPKNTEFMWFVFGCIAIVSTILLILAKPWIGRDFRTQAD